MKLNLTKTHRLLISGRRLKLFLKEFSGSEKTTRVSVDSKMWKEGFKALKSFTLGAGCLT